MLLNKSEVLMKAETNKLLPERGAPDGKRSRTVSHRVTWTWAYSLCQKGLILDLSFSNHIILGKSLIPLWLNILKYSKGTLILTAFSSEGLSAIRY